MNTRTAAGQVCPSFDNIVSIVQLRNICLSISLGLCLSALANASLIYTLTEVGPDVVGSGSGTLDIADLGSPITASNCNAGSVATSGLVSGGASTPTCTGLFAITGPTSIGSSGLEYADIASGDIVGVAGAAQELFVPNGYISGASLSNSETWDLATFASLGLTPGTYTWTWGTDGHADSFTLQVGSPTPEPATFGLLCLGVFALRRPRRTTL